MGIVVAVERVVAVVVVTRSYRRREHFIGLSCKKRLRKGSCYQTDDLIHSYVYIYVYVYKVASKYAYLGPGQGHS